MRSKGPKPSPTLVLNKVEECRQIAGAYASIHFSLPLEFPTLVAQPFAMRLVVRKHTAHFMPKRWRMIPNFEVGQFMHSNVVNHLRR